jgi:hypothetical protein
MHVNDISPLPLYDPAQNVEGYTQELLARWLVFYFSGVEFQYRVGINPGVLTDKTLPLCAVGFAEAEIPDPFDKPFIHCYTLRASDSRRSKVLGDSEFVSNQVMQVDVMVPSSISTIDSLDGDRAEHHCRAIADALYWLLNTQERDALVVAGLHRIKTLSRPIVASAPTGFYKRSFAISYEFQYRIQ